MNISIKTTLSLAVLICCNLAQPTEITSIKQVADYITTQKTLIVFDIDNTLLMTPTDLGSDQWFSHHVQEIMNTGADRMTAARQILPLYYHVHFHIDMIPTEDDLHLHVEQIADNCEHVVCLTARSLPMVPGTIEQLKRNKLHDILCKNTERKLPVAHPCLYKEGVLFCGMNDKGTVLMAYLDSIGYCPDCIIFIDDKQKYIDSVQAAAQKRGIEFIGLRYTGCDERVRTFDIQVTTKELHEFLAEHPFNA